MNTKFCRSAKTTLARLCALKNRSSSQISEVMREIENSCIIHRKCNRLGDVMLWMRQQQLRLLERPKTKSKILEHAHLVNRILEGTDGSLLAYTDGSTKQASNNLNSGY